VSIEPLLFTPTVYTVYNRNPGFRGILEVRRAGGTGRRAGLKIRWPQGRVGSIPMPGTTLFPSPMSHPDDEIEFGFHEFARIISKEFGPALRLTHADGHLANEMLAKLPPKMSLEQVIVYMLVQMTITGWSELMILVGNGAGLGAMKISRGMFETAVMAEYLRQNPTEIDDYAEYSHIQNFNRLKQYPGIVSSERRSEMEMEYKRVEPRFANSKGRVRSHWNKHPISFMAEKIERSDQYELSYKYCRFNSSWEC
jgi:hypothetical protein